ncbi:MAG: hypothetical protein QM719_09270 [Thermomonas sp.]
MIEARNVENDPERARYWVNFVLERCEFPNNELLRLQFDEAELGDFCNCGCNSFAVKTREGVALLSSGGSFGAIFDAWFPLEGEPNSLEIILFTGETGRLEYVEVDCCGNSFPVPDDIRLAGSVQHGHVSGTLIT